MLTTVINTLLGQTFTYVLFALTFACFLIWLIDQLFLGNYKRVVHHLPKNLINKICGLLPYLLILTVVRLILMLRQGLDFDFNYILVPAVLFLFSIIIADKLIYQDRKTLGKGKERSVISNAYDFLPILMVVLIVRSFVFEPFNIPSSSMVPTLYTGDFITVNKAAYGLRLPLLNTKVLDTGSPEHGDVAVFRYPEDPKIHYIKRVIGLPGDMVSYDNGVLSINGSPLPTKRVDFTADKALVNGLYPEGTDIGTKLLTADEANRLSQEEESIATYWQETQGQHTHLVREIGNIESAAYARFLQKNSPEVIASEGKKWQIKVPAGQYFVMGDNRDRSKDGRFWGFVPDKNLAGKASYIWMHKEPGLKMPSFGRNGRID